MRAKCGLVVVLAIATLGIVAGCSKAEKNANAEHSSVSTQPPNVQRSTGTETTNAVTTSDPMVREALTNNKSVLFPDTEMGSADWKKKVSDRTAALDQENARLEDEICEQIKQRGETLYPNDLTQRSMVISAALRSRANELYPNDEAARDNYFDVHYKKVMGQ